MTDLAIYMILYDCLERPSSNTTPMLPTSGVVTCTCMLNTQHYLTRYGLNVYVNYCLAGCLNGDPDI